MAGSTNKSGFKKAASSPDVNKKMKSYSQDPFFVKKAREAKALIAKYGLPKNLSR